MFKKFMKLENLGDCDQEIHNLGDDDVLKLRMSNMSIFLSMQLLACYWSVWMSDFDHGEEEGPSL